MGTADAVTIESVVRPVLQLVSESSVASFCGHVCSAPTHYTKQDYKVFHATTIYIHVCWYLYHSLIFVLFLKEHHVDQENAT